MHGATIKIINSLLLFILQHILDFSCKFYSIFYIIIIIPLLGIIFYIFHQTDGEGEASSIAHFSFMYLLPEDG